MRPALFFLIAALAFDANALPPSQSTRIVRSTAAEGVELLPSSVYVFTSPSESVSIDDALAGRLSRAGTQLEVHPVDALRNVEAALSASLPRDAAQAEAQMRQRIKVGNADAAAIQRAWLTVFLARQFQLTKVPAIVFDKSYVVYGIRDLDVAIGMYQQARADNGIEP